MIKRITANNPAFRPVSFAPGLNLVLADVTATSGKKDTRNGVGKTSLLEIVHFCFGSSPRKGDTLKESALAGWAFSLTFDLNDREVTVTRAIGTSARSVTLDAGDGGVVMPLRQWTDLLGRELFDLPARESTEAVVPSFRSLISYIVRRDRYAYDHPFDHHPKTLAWDRQVNIAYLLDLGWRDAASFEIVRRKKKWLRDQKSASKAGISDARPANRGRAEADRVRLEESARVLATDLAAFRVHPEYRKVEEEANQLTRALQEIVNLNVADKNLLAYYVAAVRSEAIPEDREILELFDAAQVELPGAVRRDLHALRDFHTTLISNRRSFLSAETKALEEKIAARDQEALRLTNERAARLEILQSHGALEEYARLQARLTERREQLARAVAQIDSIDRLERGARDLRTEAQVAYDHARTAHDERHAQREKAISLFNAFSEYLYALPGNLILDVKLTKQMPTLELGVEILRSKATGIEHMKTLCLDLTIAALWAERPKKPGFLIHDSTLFEGVDERQRSLALALVEKESRERGYQYILALNTDELPASLPDGFEPRKYERLRLTDEPATASIFGIRF